MKREARIPRIDWPRKVEELGFAFHTFDGEPYWDERAAYRFSAEEIDTLEAATAEIHARCLDAVRHVVERGDYERLRIPAAFHGYVERSWREAEKSLYGRMDLAWDGTGDPKLLEYNADTPTALLEASVVQWYWLQEAAPGMDQFNSIHEKLIARWKEMRPGLPQDGAVHFTCDSESDEDRGTVDYLRDTAQQSGLTPLAIDIADIGWDGRRFVDLNGRAMRALFKLYPWEWMVREAFGPNLLGGAMRVIEPPWKMLLSNKAILPILWELFPDHPNLLEASFEPGRFATDFVRKPIYSREGANVSITHGGATVEAEGDYGAEGYVWQAYQALPEFDGNHTVIGSWVVGEDPAGIGIREDDSPITRNTSRFVPHYFEP
jgi:glutathionylspermidine synthase